MFFRYLAATQFESTAARQSFPCFDEPAMKANFSMSIVRDKDFISLFNMPLVSSTSMEHNLMIDRFQQSVKMSTYLVAYIVCDFASITNKTKAGTDVSWTRQDDLCPLPFKIEMQLVKTLIYWLKMHKHDYYGLKFELRISREHCLKNKTDHQHIMRMYNKFIYGIHFWESSPNWTSRYWSPALTLSLLILYMIGITVLNDL